MKAKLPLYLALLLLTQCSKCKNADPAPQDPAAQLPPATQTGANTLGCLINGQPYTPQGRVGLGANFAVSYDPGFNGGDLGIGTYRVNDRREQTTIVFHFAPISSVGTYSLNSPAGIGSVGYTDSRDQSLCGEVFTDPSSYMRGFLRISRLDGATGIVSGTFELKFVRPGCDTIRLTQGRFDAKL